MEYINDQQYSDGTERKKKGFCEQYLKVLFEGTYNAYNFSTKLIFY